MLRAALVIALTAVSGLNYAQHPMCTEQNQTLNHLSNQYSEAPIAMGVINNGAKQCQLYDCRLREQGSFAKDDKGRPAPLTSG